MMQQKILGRPDAPCVRCPDERRLVVVMDAMKIQRQFLGRFLGCIGQFCERLVPLTAPVGHDDELVEL